MQTAVLAGLQSPITGESVVEALNEGTRETWRMIVFHHTLGQTNPTTMRETVIGLAVVVLILIGTIPRTSKDVARAVVQFVEKIRLTRDHA